MAYKYNGKVIRAGRAWSSDAGHHPANWMLLTDEAKAEIGLVYEADPVVASFDNRFYWAAGIERALDDVNETNEDGTAMLDINGQQVDGSVSTPDRKFRDAWTYDGNVVSIDPTAKVAIMGRLVKEECRNRIYAVVDQIAQINLAAACAAGALTPEDKATYDLGLFWIHDMRSTVAALVAADDQDYADDSKWPAVPAGVVELADKY